MSTNSSKALQKRNIKQKSMKAMPKTFTDSSSSSKRRAVARDRVEWVTTTTLREKSPTHGTQQQPKTRRSAIVSPTDDARARTCDTWQQTIGTIWIVSSWRVRSWVRWEIMWLYDESLPPIIVKIWWLLRLFKIIQPKPTDCRRRFGSGKI